MQMSAMADHALSLSLAIPRLRRWREASGVAGRRGSIRRLFNLHRAPGMWALPSAGRDGRHPRLAPVSEMPPVQRDNKLGA